MARMLIVLAALGVASCQLPHSAPTVEPPVVGSVVDAAGSPAAGVKIAAFNADELPSGVSGLVGNAGAGLVGNVGGGLIGNVGGALAGAAPGASTRRIAAVSGTTGTDGSFVFKPDASGQFNLEADAGSTKAWKFRLDVKRGLTQSLKLRLAPPGALAGKVVAPGAGTASIVVWMPGSVYWVHASADGTYKFDDLPPGKFEVHAWASGYKVGGILGDDYDDPLVVRSGTTSVVPDLTLKAL